ncbi:bifunctional acetate--CoA ligase family protein/GNAT family N-acetyltransferase [Streptomyces sp. NBC_01497]|uniref:bifunctional acetate--CoA ligase family protein/GNAT family N-acetyltransferase n=1 Tax=Streptomyces sp. NBC_01497 TaxID=2903885 RepID=UPI002E37F480|nr:GNAT family N-acetyltransferase [Streptomyces sp. NBC_01497]
METPSAHAYPDHWEADVVLRDGGTARVRPMTPDDADRLVSFYEHVSDQSKYYRFFAPYPRLSDKDVHRFTHHDYVDRVGLAMTVGGEIIATVRYDRIGPDGRVAAGPGAEEAEVAFLVQDTHQGRGVASALLEHIAAVARERGIRRFAAEVLPQNGKMIKVFMDAGFTQRRSFEDGAVRLTLDLEPTERSLAVQRGREQRAEARSVQRLLAPGSVAVVGAGREPGGVGRSVLRNLLSGGYRGRTYAVNEAFPPGLSEIDGVPAARSVTELAEPVDLAVVAVPAERVPEVVDDCGEHGVQGLVVLSAGYAESGAEGRARQRELVRRARTYGMRIIGPNAFGIVNTADAVRLNASLAPTPPARGRIGLFTQSGAIGIALLSGLHRRGAGLSSFISAGNRADVSGNDFLQFGYEDPDTDVVLMYLESIGNPRKFTRLARRTAAAKPVVVVKGARHSGAMPQGHAVPETRIPDATVSALLRQAGVLRADTVTELVDAGLLLADQPLPAGPRVAIVGNSESLGLLTYDACLTEGLRPLAPQDLTTSATAGDFRGALARALHDPACDAVVVTAIPRVGTDVPTAAGALAAALREAAATSPAKPVAVVYVEIGGLAEALSAATSTAPQVQLPLPAASAPSFPQDPAPAVGPGPGTTGPDAATTSPAAGTAGSDAGPPATSGTSATSGPSGTTDTSGTTDADAEPGGPRPPAGRIPAYPAAERAVRALAVAVEYARWRRESAEPGRVPEYDDIDQAAAGTLVRRVLGAADEPGATALPDRDARALLGHYGIHVLGTRAAPGPDEAVRAARDVGYPVVLKTTAPHLRHRADLGGVRLGLGDEAQLRTAYRELTASLGGPAELRPVVQAMAPRGVDTVVRATLDPAAGAVLSFGLAGVPSELLGDLGHRLVPASDRDVAELIRSIRTAPLLFGWRGADPVDTDALAELLLRVSRLVDDHPEIVALTLDPVVVGTRGLTVLDAHVRLAPPPALGDLGPRRLPEY